MMMAKYDKKKRVEYEAPNDEYFWKHRHEIWALHPDMIIEEPEHLKRLRKKVDTNEKDK